MFASRMKRHRRSEDSVSRTLLSLRWLVGLLVVALVPAAVGVAATRAPAGATQTAPTLHTAAAARPCGGAGRDRGGLSVWGGCVRPSEAARSVADVSAKRNLLVPGAQLVSVERGQSVQEAVTELEQRPDVRYAEPNWIYHASNDAGRSAARQPVGSAQHRPRRSTATPRARPTPTSTRRRRGTATGQLVTVVAVVDSGVACDHPDLAPNIWSNGGESQATGSTTTATARWMTSAAGTSWTATTTPGIPTVTARTSPARSPPAGTTGWASPGWRGRPRSCRSACWTPSARAPTRRRGRSRTRRRTGRGWPTPRLAAPGNSQAISDAIGSHPNTLFVIAAGNEGRTTTRSRRTRAQHVGKRHLRRGDR